MFRKSRIFSKLVISSLCIYIFLFSGHKDYEDLNIPSLVYYDKYDFHRRFYASYSHIFPTNSLLVNSNSSSNQAVLPWLKVSEHDFYKFNKKTVLPKRLAVWQIRSADCLF